MKYQGIFASDLDGTLLRDGILAEADVAALERLSSQGVLRVLATGRSLRSLQTCLPPDFPVDYVVLSTGNQIVHWASLELLHSSHLPAPAVQSIGELLTSLNVGFMVHDPYPDTHLFRFRTGSAPASDFHRRLARQSSPGQPWTEREIKDASQFLAILEPDQTDQRERIATLRDTFSVIQATSPLDNASMWMEIFAPNVSKTWGIKRIQAHHDLHNAPVAAIGNDYNDQDMLDFADISFRVPDAFLDPSPAHITTPQDQTAVAFAATYFTDTLGSKQ